MATKDKGPKQEQRECPREDPQTDAPDQEAEARDCKVMRRIRGDDATRAARAAPKGSRHVRVVAIGVLGSSEFN